MVVSGWQPGGKASPTLALARKYKGRETEDKNPAYVVIYIIEPETYAEMNTVSRLLHPGICFVMRMPIRGVRDSTYCQPINTSLRKPVD